MATVLVCCIATGTIAGVIFRPLKWSEAVWACLGAALLVILGLISPAKALHAVGEGTDVYLFLTGMMLLSELARLEGVFDWLAGLAVQRAAGSRTRLFLLVYAVGMLVTILLSNDATAVVLTPAVYAAVKKAKAPPMPYLLICAFIANAASFVLPISNPANLVVYGAALPKLLPWLRQFALPSLLSIAATFIVLRFLSRRDLQGAIPQVEQTPALSPKGRRTAWGIAFTGAILLAASFTGCDLGWPTCVAALLVIAITTWGSAADFRTIASDVSWSVLPLVAGLFVLVAALETHGAERLLAGVFHHLAAWSPAAGRLGAAFGVAGLSNIMNNLPSGLLTSGALKAAAVPASIHSALLIGVDLGPNLSVTGSLATILWLVALRREGEPISAWEFLKCGILVMPPALALAALAAR